MCVICTTFNGVKMTEEEIRKCWQSNSDGGGYAFVDENNKIVIKKHMELNPFLEMLMDDQEKYSDDTPFVVHFRIASHGSVNIDNCHPFYVNPKVVFAHNGIMSNAATLIPKGSAYSDTVALNKHVLQQLPWNFLNNRGFEELIYNYIGTTNKLAFIDDTRKLTVFNEYQGEGNIKDKWFSNDFWSWTPSNSHYAKMMGYQGNYTDWDYLYPEKQGVYIWDEESQSLIPESEAKVEDDWPIDNSFADGIEFPSYNEKKVKEFKKSFWANEGLFNSDIHELCELCGGVVRKHKYMYLTECCIFCALFFIMDDATALDKCLAMEDLYLDLKDQPKKGLTDYYNIKTKLEDECMKIIKGQYKESEKSKALVTVGS